MNPVRTALLAAALVLAEAAQAQGPSVLSADGLWHLQSDGGDLVLRNASGVQQRRWPAPPVLQILPLAPRRSFLIAFEQGSALWELQLDPAAEPIFNGLVHDYRLGEGLAEPGYLGLRRTRLPEPVQAMVTDRSGAWVLARGPDQADGRAVLHLMQLDIRKAVARFVVDADPVLEQALPGGCEPRECLRVPDRRGGPALLLDWRAARLQDRADGPDHRPPVRSPDAAAGRGAADP